MADLEYRLGRVEDKVNEYTVLVSQQSTQLEYLQNGMDDLKKQFDAMTSMLTTKVEHQEEHTAARDLKLGRIDGRIKELEAKEEEAKRRKRLIVTVLLSLFTALGGAFATRVVEHFTSK
jgi:uncharacterized coiled-coil protein SlyX